MDITEHMEAAIEQIFANVLICKDLVIAQQVAHTHAIDCVTFEGDMVSPTLHLSLKLSNIVK